ncbi:MAG: DUF4116 domain-containing protein [Legionellaceae bacterium]|nr:DUF4116 domain-containing protein [Legionellaceae bacterium]
MFFMKKASSTQKSDKNFVIKAVSRPGVVTQREYKPNPAYNPLASRQYYREQNERAYLGLPANGSSVDELRLSPCFEVTTKHYELEYVSREFQDDKDVVLAALKYDVGAIRFASPRLQNDPDVIYAGQPSNLPLNAFFGCILASVVFVALITVSPLFLIGVFAGLVASILCLLIDDKPTPPDMTEEFSSLASTPK